MTKNKLAIIGGSGLYDIEGLEKPKWNKIKTPWGNPSDKILGFKSSLFSFYKRFFYGVYKVVP